MSNEQPRSPQDLNLRDEFNEAARGPHTQEKGDGDRGRENMEGNHQPETTIDPAMSEMHGEFHEAASGEPHDQLRDEDAQKNTRLKEALEAERATPEYEPHLRPDDKRLVAAVHQKVEADRELEIRRLTPVSEPPSADREPDLDLDPDLDPDPGPELEPW